MQHANALANGSCSALCCHALPSNNSVGSGQLHWALLMLAALDHHMPGDKQVWLLRCKDKPESPVLKP